MTVVQFLNHQVRHKDPLICQLALDLSAIVITHDGRIVAACVAGCLIVMDGALSQQRKIKWFCILL